MLAKWCCRLDARGVAQPAEAAASEAAAAIFDRGRFLKRLMGDRQLASVILKEFLEDFPSHS